jgi:DNA-binding response OmpR family regulator
MSAILLVDDNPAVRNIVGDVLEDAGHVVSGVATGAEAIALLERGSFDLLILDYLLPDMKGDAIARVVRERWSTLRIAFLSGYTDFLALTGKHGEDTLISKPISIEDLCKAVEGALRKQSALAAAA